MQKKKSEIRKEINDSVAAWLESGKKITSCPPRKARGHYTKDKSTPMQAVDMSSLPSSLKIRYGIK
jgi:hypothetical protein